MKIGFWTVLIWGIAIGLVAVAYGWFHHMSPNSVETQYNKDVGDQLDQIIAQKGRAEARVQRANEIVAERERLWAQIVSVKTPPASVAAGGINLARAPFDLLLDVRTYRNSIQTAVNTQVKKGGVRVLTGPELPQPPSDPGAVVASFFNYPAVPFPIVMYDFGTVVVEGTYEQIIENVKSWKDMPNYMAVTHGLSFTGTSPVLTARYNVSMIGYIRGNVIYTGIPGGGAAAAAPGGGANQPRGGGRRGV